MKLEVESFSGTGHLYPEAMSSVGRVWDRVLSGDTGGGHSAAPQLLNRYVSIHPSIYVY